LRIDLYQLTPFTSRGAGVAAAEGAFKRQNKRSWVRCGKTFNSPLNRCPRPATSDGHSQIVLFSEMNIVINHRATFLSENVRRGASFARHRLGHTLSGQGNNLHVPRARQSQKMSLCMHLRRLHTYGLSFKPVTNDGAPSRPYFVFWRPFRSSATASQVNGAAGAPTAGKAKLSKTSFKRLIGLAKPEKWKLTGDVIVVVIFIITKMCVLVSTTWKLLHNT
jgi:hypothetical protein